MSLNVGFVGWRGMVGSVLMDRMRAEGDFAYINAQFFSTSQIGQSGPDVAGGADPLGDAMDISALKMLDVVVSCQGGGYTNAVYPELRASGWNGFWIDAASSLRMDDDAVIVLDPVNRNVIDSALFNGVKTFVGGNCTVSLLLMAMGGLFDAGVVEWISTMTYQSASGAGARNIRELLQQMCVVGAAPGALLDDPSTSILEIDRLASAALASDEFPTSCFGAPLAASLIPWIDRLVDGGQTREEWKGHVEANKILQASPEIVVDGLCVRVGAMRCHSQAVTVKLRRDLPMDELESMVEEHSEWSELVPNDMDSTLARLSPAAVSGRLSVPVGRMHKLRMGPEYLGLFTVGDQLLWGAAEPLRRMLRILVEFTG